MFTFTINNEVSNKTLVSFRRELIIYGSPKRYPIFHIKSKGSGETPTPYNYKVGHPLSNKRRTVEVDEVAKHDPIEKLLNSGRYVT